MTISHGYSVLFDIPSALSGSGSAPESVMTSEHNRDKSIGIEGDTHTKKDRMMMSLFPGETTEADAENNRTEEIVA